MSFRSREEEALVLADWIDALADLPKQAIELGVRDWIRDVERLTEEGRDPRATPTVIRRYAKRRVKKAEPQSRAEHLPFAPQEVELTEGEKAARREVWERAGFTGPKLVPKAPGD